MNTYNTYKENKRERIVKQRQKRMQQKFILLLAANLLFVFAIMIVSIINGVSGNNQIEEGSKVMVYESNVNFDQTTVIPSANASNKNQETTQTVSETMTEKTTTKQFSRNLSNKDKYLLAKIAMAESEGESLECKMMVIFTVLNRVKSDDRDFPDTIKEVIFKCNKGVYQFSPVAPGGRWWRVEPNEECWEAVEMVNIMKEDISKGALYFESCKGESWHSKNLKFICQIGPMKFYK